MPELDVLYDLDKCIFRRYLFSNDLFTVNFKKEMKLSNETGGQFLLLFFINLYFFYFYFYFWIILAANKLINDSCDPQDILVFYNQIPTEDLKSSALNTLFLNSNLKTFYSFNFLEIDFFSSSLLF